MATEIRDEKMITYSGTREEGYVMRWEDAERFLSACESKGRAKATIVKYRRALEIMYEVLPGDKTIRRGTLADYKDVLLKRGYSASSVNVIFTACDRFLAFMNHRECQVGERLTVKESSQPELTRSEYLRLLSTAREQKNERLYLLVKVLTCTGLTLKELEQLTIEKVRDGRLEVSLQGTRRMVRIPESLRRELIEYAERNNIETGAIFCNTKGRPLNRSQITVFISQLCEAAGIPAGKGTPRSLHRLFLTTWDTIWTTMQVLMEQTMDRQIDEEQLKIGWNVQRTAIEPQ